MEIVGEWTDFKIEQARFVGFGDVFTLADFEEGIQL